MLERKVTLERMGMKVGVDTMDARMKDFDRELDLIHGRLEQAQAMLEQSPARRTALVAEAAAPPAEHAFARPPRANRTRSMSLSRWHAARVPAGSGDRGLAPGPLGFIDGDPTIHRCGAGFHRRICNFCLKKDGEPDYIYLTSGGKCYHRKPDARGCATGSGK